MASPLLVVEYAVKIVVDQWLYGLAPSLKLSTKPDGTVVVKADVASYPAAYPEPNISSNDNSSDQPSNARIRRRRRRRVKVKNEQVSNQDIDYQALLDKSSGNDDSAIAVNCSAMLSPVRCPPVNRNSL